MAIIISKAHVERSLPLFSGGVHRGSVNLSPGENVVADADAAAVMKAYPMSFTPGGEFEIQDMAMDVGPGSIPEPEPAPTEDTSDEVLAVDDLDEDEEGE